jgi:DNA primase
LELKLAAPAGVRVDYAIADAGGLTVGKQYAPVLLITTSGAPKSYSEWPSLQDSVVAHRTELDKAGLSSYALVTGTTGLVVHVKDAENVPGPRGHDFTGFLAFESSPTWETA